MRFLVALLVVGLAVYFIAQRAPAPLGRSTQERQTSLATEPAPRRADDRGLELTPEAIRAGLDKTGAVVRERARTLGEHFDDARIVAAIKSKFALDADLDSLGLEVTCEDGRVTLSGSVGSAELAQRAVELARQTEGVRAVDSRIKTQRS